MVSSIFYGHNEQAGRCAFASLLSLGRGKDAAQNLSTKRRWGAAEQGQHCCLQEVMVGACVAPARAAEVEVPSSPSPGQICPSSSAQHTPLPLRVAT